LRLIANQKKEGMMKTVIVWASAMLALAAAGSAIAQANAVIEAVQSPAWIERGGRTLPAAPGMQLQDRDQLRTGSASRVLLRLPEGSTVKLGENARYRIDIQQRKGNTYLAAMNVFEGAFRFTTNVLRKVGGKRDVRIQFPTVTAGIRGTDVWGKSDPTREIVCLIEGTVEVERGKDKPTVLNQPLQFYIAPKDKPAEPVGFVDKKQIDEWSAETEIQPGRGAPRRGGAWRVLLASVDTQADALKLYDAVRLAGYPADIAPTKVNNKSSYDVRISQLPSQREAQALADVLKGKYGVAEPSVARAGAQAAPKAEEAPTK